MDNRQGPTPYSSRSPVLPTAPLRTINQSNQAQSAQGEEYPASQPWEKPVYPPRTSSITKRDNTDRHEILQGSHNRQNCVNSEVASIHSASSISSGYSGKSPYAKYFERLAAEAAAAVLSGATNLDAHHLAEPSAEILGNFIAMETTKKVANPFTGKEITRTPYKSTYPHGKAKVIPNPYEFEPGSPYDNLARQTTFTDFIESQNDVISSPRLAHVKNARSVGNTKLAARPNSLEDDLPTPTGRRLHRCESSPSVAAGPILEHHSRSRSPESTKTVDSYYFGKYNEPMLATVTQRGRQSKNTTSSNEHRGSESQSPSRKSNRGRNNEMRSREPGATSKSPSKTVRDPIADQPSRGRQHGHDSGSHPSKYQKGPGESYNRSPTHSHRQGQANELDAKPYRAQHSRGPTENPNNASEYKEEVGNEDDSLFVEPKKRSRSPMKKMFGQGGWLGNSPAEINDFKQPPKKGSYEKKTVEKKQEAASKTSVMGKIRSKLEEFAEKADISPSRSGRAKSDKHPKIAALTVSIGPPEQARVYMELELMLVHTANCFLMTQFRQGRIEIDTIKKTYDNWKNKGRPSVVEFMYDQATQRDLIAANQHNFRFYGERSCDGIRVNSMLYNWKVVASQMAIRTFCNADTVVLKLVFDLEQILELLGAAEGILLRLQNIRLSVNEIVLVARKQREAEAEKFANGRHISFDNRVPNEEFSRRAASGDPYGGLKLVPDFYADKS